MKQAFHALVLIALLAAGFVLWRIFRAEPATSAPSGGAPAAGVVARFTPWRRSVCATCNGTGQIPCATCGGSGQVERVDRVPCPHCGGSGRYQPRLGARKESASDRSDRRAPAFGAREGPCPFCGGTGQIERTNTVACAFCGGTGRQPCPACAAPR